MPFFRVVAAKNGQKVELTAKFDSDAAARESLHKDGYSIIEIRETAAPQETSGAVFYFEIELNGQKKKGQIKSDDIFKAYKKLTDDLGYHIVSIASTADASDEEKTYTTAKVRETYNEFKRMSPTKESDKDKEKEKIKEKNDRTESTEQEGVLAKEVKKYQAVITLVYNKFELFVNTYSDTFGEQRISKIKEFIPVLRQLRQSSNLDKLKIVGEAALVKIGELELELLAQNKKLERSQFLKETNSLLKDLGSNKKIGNDLDVAKKKIKQFFEDLRTNNEIDDKIPTKKIDAGSFVYLKNLRELSLYKERLSAIKKEILKSFFGNSVKKKRLLLKKKLIEQNIQIIESRISLKTFSYTKIVKGAMYYEEVIVFLIKSLADIVLYALATTILVFCVLTLLNIPIVEQLLKIVFFGAIFSSFVIIFNNVRSFFGITLGFGIFFLVTLVLQINF